MTRTYCRLCGFYAKTRDGFCSKEHRKDWNEMKEREMREAESMKPIEGVDYAWGRLA